MEDLTLELGRCEKGYEFGVSRKIQIISLTITNKSNSRQPEPLRPRSPARCRTAHRLDKEMAEEDKLKENRFLKGGLYFTLLGGVIDTITWSNLPDSKEKKEVEDTIDALSDANQSLIDAKNAEIAELKAQLGQASQASPLDASSAPTVRGIDGLDEVNASGMQILTDKMNADPKFAPIPSVIRP